MSYELYLSSDVWQWTGNIAICIIIIIQFLFWLCRPYCKFKTNLLQIKDDIERFKAQGVELESQRQQILANLEKDQADASKQADDFNEKHAGVMKILDQLRAGNLNTFLKILKN